ncbi:transcription initiation factor IIB [Nowakowskiella sp. JEL0407]|nr:transcription initiation factor IIB [Nowakowskiella sp. JEL0407]
MSAPPKQIDLNLRLICRDCKEFPPNIVEDFSAGDLVCGSCGLVLGNRIIDTRSEWRTFSNDDGGDDPSRVGGPSDGLRDSLEATQISGKDGGSGKAKELNKAHRRAVAGKGERELINAFKEIQSHGEKIGLSKAVIDVAKHLYKKADDKKLTRGKVDGFIAACIYIACRERNAGRTFKEIGALLKIEKKIMARCYKIIQAEGLMDQNQNQNSNNPESHISRFAAHLNFPPEVRSGTLAVRKKKIVAVCGPVVYPNVARKAQELGTLEGKSPITFVAACLFFVSSILQNSRNVHEIAEIAGCTDLTLKNAYRLLYAVKEKLIAGDIRMEQNVKFLPVY